MWWCNYFALIHFKHKLLKASFAAGLEALRKESTASTISTSSLNLPFDTISSYYRPKGMDSRDDSKK